MIETASKRHSNQTLLSQKTNIERAKITSNNHIVDTATSMVWSQCVRFKLLTPINTYQKKKQEAKVHLAKFTKMDVFCTHL